jgi:hypothetical protein
MVKKEAVEETSVQELQVEPTPFDEFVEHEKKAVQEFGKAFAAMLPEGLREHGKTGVEEMIEGYRRLFNATLDDIIKRVEKSKIEISSSSKKTKVDIK